MPEHEPTGADPNGTVDVAHPTHERTIADPDGTVDGVPVTIEDTEQHRGETMHYVRTPGGTEAWVFADELANYS